MNIKDRILQVLAEAGPCTISELAKRTFAARYTSAQYAIYELGKEGKVVPCGHSVSRCGLKPLIWTLA